jgi:hypothetical protein
MDSLLRSAARRGESCFRSTLPFRVCRGPRSWSAGELAADGFQASGPFAAEILWNAAKHYHRAGVPQRLTVASGASRCRTRMGLRGDGVKSPLMHLRPKFLLPLILLFAAARAFGQRIQFKTLDPSIIEARLRSAPLENSKREAGLKEMLAAAGCQPANLSEQPVQHIREPNVICFLPGELPAQIVVGAHFDHVDVGQGVVDNWSGAALLADLLESISMVPRRHTFVFVGFTAEERGLVGSQFYVKHLTPEQLKTIDAMVNIDSVGMTTTRVWVHHSDPKLVALIFQVAASMKLPVEGVNVENVGSADSESFARHKVPAITVHSATQENFKILHSRADDMRAISLHDYYDTYKLLTAYLAACDVVLSPAAAPAASGTDKK